VAFQQFRWLGQHWQWVRWNLKMKRCLRAYV